MSLRRVDEDVRGGEPPPQVSVITRQVAPDRNHLDARHPVPHQPVEALRIPVLRGSLDRVLADVPRSHHGHAHGGTCRGGELGPSALQHLERGLETIPGDRLAVHDEPTALVVLDRVEADGVDPELLQVLHAGRPRREVQHRDQRRTAADLLELADRCPEDHDDVLTIRGVLVDDVDPRGRQVVLVEVAHPGADPGLDQHLASEVGQEMDQGREEVPPLSRFLVHHREAERQPVREPIHLDTSALATARSTCDAPFRPQSPAGFPRTTLSTGSSCSPYVRMLPMGSSPGHE